MPCPGYKIPKSRIFELQRPNPSSPFASEAEKSRHDYFVDVGSKILATFQLNSMPFWSRLAPQLGQHHAAVRHGLTALGALQAPLHGISAAKLQSMLRCEITSLAMLHVQKSMYIVRTADPASLPVEVFLTCCMLFTAMQFWIEKTSAAATHVLAANRIVQENLVPGTSARVPGSAISREFAAVYIPSLNELINQHCAFSDDFPPAESGILADHQLDFDVEQIATLCDKTGVVDAIDRLLKCVLRATSKTQTTQTLKNRIALALDALESKLQEMHMAGILKNDSYDWTHLDLHLQAARVMSLTLGRRDEVGFDGFHAEFRLIVAHCRKMIEWDASHPPKKILNAHLGVLPPLFFVATRCREPRLRHEALELLHDAKVSERGWTSCIAFTIAQFVVHAEENVLNVLPEKYGTAALVVHRIRLHQIDVSNRLPEASVTYDVFSSPVIDGGPPSTIAACSVARHKSKIAYPTHPVVHIDGATCPLPQKVLRACGYSSILLFRAPVECHCLALDGLSRERSVLEARDVVLAGGRQCC
jgi:hypothetical protein